MRREQLDRARRFGQRDHELSRSPADLRGWRLTDGVEYPVTITRNAVTKCAFCGGQFPTGELIGVSIGIGGKYAVAVACRGCLADQDLETLLDDLARWNNS
jgi:hypothetical protein